MKIQITHRNLLSGMAATAFARAPRAKAAARANTFALIGDRYHNSGYIKTALRKTLVKDLAISIYFRDEVKLLNSQELSGYKRKVPLAFRRGGV